METYTKWLTNQKYIAGHEEPKIFNYNQAIQLYSDAIELNKDLPQYYKQYDSPKNKDKSSFQLGQLLTNYKNKFQEKDYDSCLSVMTEAIKIFPGELHLQLRMAKCMLWKKCVTEAMNIAQRVIELDSLSAEAHYTVGLIYFHRDMPDEAKESLKCSLQNDQEYTRAITLQGLIEQILEYKTQAKNLFNAGQFKEALEVYLNILKLDIKDNDEVTSKMFYNCALMHFNLGNFEDAILNCNDALQKNPKYYKALWERAQCHFNLKKYDNCLRDCIEAYNIEMTTDVKDLLIQALKYASDSLVNPGTDVLNVGNELYQNGLYTEAIEFCSEAITSSPRNIKFYELRIECAIKCGNYQMALKDLATLTLIDNKKNEERELLELKCLISNGDLDKAKAKAKDINPVSRADKHKDKYMLLENQLGTAFKVRDHFENEKYMSSLHLLKNLCKKFDMKPLSSTYKLMKAECLYNTCNYDKSMVILNEVLQSDPSNAKAYYLKGLICFNALELNKSIEHFTQCLEYNSEIVEAQIMLQKTIEIKAKIDLEPTMGCNDKYIRCLVLHQQAKCVFPCGKYDICIDYYLQMLEMTESKSVQTLLDSAREQWLTTRQTVIKETRIKEKEKLKIDEGLKFLDKSNFKQACVCFTEAIEINSDNPQSYVYRAECNMHLKLYESSIADAELSTKINPIFLKGYLLAARCYMIMGDIFSTDVTLERIKKLSKVDTTIESIMDGLRTLETAVKCATKFFNNMDYRKCIEEIESALKIAHESNHLRMIKAECLIWLGEYYNAEFIMHSLPPTNGKDYIEGMFYYMTNNLRYASQCLDRYMKNDPGHKSAKRLLSNSKSFMMRIDRGNELMKMGKFDDAINIFTEAMMIDKKHVVVNSRLHLRCAECNYKLGYLKECLNECNSALKFVPGLREATKLQDQCKTDIAKIENEKKIANEAAMHIRNGDDFKQEESWERAIASYSKAIDLKPDEASYYHKRAECYWFYGYYVSTLADARKSTELDKTIIDGYIWEAKCLILLGETESQKKISEIFEQIETIENSNIDHKNEIFELRKMCKLFFDATASFKKKEYIQAIQYIDDAFNNFPNCITSHYKIMKTECLIRLFRFNEASQNITHSESTKSHHLLFLKGLWFYFRDNFKNAVEYFNSYKSHPGYQKNDEVEILIKISEILMDAIKQCINSIGNNDNEKLFNTLNTEIAKYASQEDIMSKEIFMKLHYQRAIVNEEMGKTNDAIEDCSNALCINSSYVNVLKLRQHLYELECRYKESISDCATLLAIEENEDTKREYEKLKIKATQRQVNSTREENGPV